MLYGITNNSTRIRAQKGAAAVCPHCRGPLTAKCGQIKIHHWAHKAAKSCLYSSGMTAWHYGWLDRFDNHPQPGWEIEYFHKSIRFDAFNTQEMWAVEFQRSIDVDYIRTKVSICRSEGIKLFWLISPDPFKNFVYTDNFMQRNGHVLFARRKCRRRIDVLLEDFLGRDDTALLIDFREQTSLPRYATDCVDIMGGLCCTDTSVGSEEAHPMPTGIYALVRPPQTALCRCHPRFATTLFLEQKNSWFS